MKEKVGIVGIVAVLGGVLMLLSGVLSEAPSASLASMKRVVTKDGKFSLGLPSTWNVADRNNSLNLYRHAFFISESCDSATDFTSVALRVFHEGETTPAQASAKRPRHFGPRSGRGLQRNVGGAECGELNQWIPFGDRGESFVASFTFGRDVSPRQRAAAYRVLETFRVETR